MPTWIPCTAERYDEMMGAVPPIPGPLGFLLGEASDSWGDGPTPGSRTYRYRAFVQIAGQHYECSEPLTVAAFRSVIPSDVVPHV